MSDKESSKPPVSEIERRFFTVAVLSFIVGFAGLIVAFTVNYPTIYTYFSSYFFPKADFKLESWTTPTFLSIDFRQSLSVSTEYFVVTSIALKSEEPYVGDPLQFSISFENKGKKSIEQPIILFYSVDFMNRVWCIWNKSVTKDELAKGCSIEYHFPPLDQKTVGSWAFFVLLYDDAEGVLVSYEAKAFRVTDVPPEPWWRSLLILLGFTGFTFAITFGVDKLREIRRKRRTKVSIKK